MLPSALECVGHGGAVLGVSGLLFWLFVEPTTAVVLADVIDEPKLRSFLAPELMLHLGLSACLWLLVYLLGAFIWQAREPATVKLIDNQRGTVMTETLIALPVLLMLIFGIAQLTVNNMAGIFANLATIQAARTAWLWEREPCNSIECDPGERARIQAAAVLTPVAPGAQRIGGGTLSQAAQQMRATLAGAQHPRLTEDSGQLGFQMVDAVDLSRRQSANFARAVDNQSFSVRTIRKFTFAYHATNVDVSNPSSDVVRVELTYRHYNAFPFVGRLFGEVADVAGRLGHYADIERTFEMKRLPRPNREAVVAPDHPKLY